jgi:DNA-directed RNA polymerase subunit alpha
MTGTETLDQIAEQIRSGELDGARRALDSIEPDEENRDELFYYTGLLKEREYDHEGALHSFEAAIEQNPEHLQAIFRAAYVCDKGGDDETAIELYERCTGKTPAPVHAMVNLAILYEDQGMLREAEALLQHVLSEHPNHARARRLLKSVDGSYTMVYDERTQREREKRDAVLDTPISDFELSVRSRNCLRQMNIRTLGDLLRTTEAELLSYKNFGETSLNEIKAMLTQRGLRLGQTLQPVAQPATPQLTSLPPGSSPHINRPVTELELSVRSRKALQRLGVTTLGELAMRSEPELLAIKNFGQTSLTEIKRQLETFGLTLRDSE